MLKRDENGRTYSTPTDLDEAGRTALAAALTRKPRIYANHGEHHTPELYYGIPRQVLADLRAKGWSAPYVVRELIDAPRPDTRPMPWQE